MDKKKVKESAALNKHLVHYLNSFEKNKEWADVGNWVQKIENLLKEHPSPYITEKVTFAKRLAQCLNPILPFGTQLNTLKVYELVFKNMQLGGTSKSSQDYIFLFSSDMGIYSCGLFPFFQYANSQVKPKVLDIIEEYYIPLGRNLIPCMPGLVISILPGLEEQNELLQKRVYTILDKAAEAVGRKYLLGSVWMAVLRSCKVRNAGLKYLSKRLPKLKADEEEKMEDDSNSEEDKSERPGGASLEKKILPEDLDMSIPSKRDDKEGAEQIPTEPIIEDIAQASNFNEEFAKQRELLLKELNEIGLNNEDNETNYPNKSSLVVNAILACLEDENNLVQRNALDFMYNHLKLNFDYFTDQEKMIFVEAVLYLLYRKELSLTRRVYSWLFGKPNLDNKYEITEKNKQVLPFIIHGFNNIFKMIPKGTQDPCFPLKIVQNFYMEHEHLVSETLADLALPILRYIYKYHEGYSFSSEVFKNGKRFMENIPSHFGILVNSLSEELINEIKDKKDEICFEIIRLIEFTYDELLKKDEGFDQIQQIIYMKSFIVGVLKSFSTLNSQDLYKFSFIVPATELTLKIMVDLQKILIDQNKEKQITSKNKLNASIDAEDDKTLKDLDEAFENIIIKFSSVFELVIKELNEESTHVKVLQVFNAFSKIIVKIQRFTKFKKRDELPDWFFMIGNCTKADNPHISMIAIECFIELLISDELDPVYSSLKHLIISESKPKLNIKNTMISGIEYTKETIRKLWSLLDIHYYQNKIIELIMPFQRYFPLIFAEVIADSFQIQTITEKENAIRRFATFWKLTGEIYKNIPITTSNAPGLFIMLDYLDHENPLIRHTSKSWLFDSIPLLYRILDPIFELLLQPSSTWYVTETKQYFYTKVYETRITNEAFRKMKSILIIANEFFLRYITRMRVSERLMEIKVHFSDDPMLQDPKLTYIDLLVAICLKYIEGQAIESLSVKFHLENASVNASSCEFLELLITNMDNKETSQKIANYLISPLLQVLQHSIENRDIVMQVQLLNILKVILFQSAYKNLAIYKTQTAINERKKEITTLLSSKKFIPCFLQGLKTEVSYVRVQFINFLSQCVFVLSEFLTHPVLTDTVKTILNAYYDMVSQLQTIDKDGNEIVNEEEEDEIEYEFFTADFDNEKKNERTSVLKIVEKKDEKLPFSNQNITSPVINPSAQNKKTNNPFSKRQQNQHEIYALLEGIKKILNFFLKFKPVDDDWTFGIEEDRNTGGVLDFMRDVLTLGFLSSNTEQKDKPSEHAETCQGLIKEIRNILNLYLFSWRLSRSFKEQIEFTNCGICPYTFEKYNNFNKLLGENLSKFDINLKTIKPQIISVIKPLTYQFNAEMMDAFLAVWNKESTIGFPKHNQRMNNEIEVLIMLNIPPDNFITSLSKTSALQTLNIFYSKKPPTTKKNVFYLNHENAIIESKILFFLYTYLTYVHIDPSHLKKEYLIALWSSFMKFYKLVANSKNPNTIFWLLELIFLLSKKYSPKEALGDSNLKKALHQEINNLLQSAANFCSKGYQIFFNDPNLLIKGKEIQNPNPYTFVMPFSPTVYELYKGYLEKIETLSGELVDNVEFMKIERIVFGNNTNSEDELYIKYRLMAFKTLKKIGLQILQNTYSPEKTDRIVLRARTFMDPIFPIMENKGPENQVYLECASELLHGLLETARGILIKEFKKPILDIFLGNDFFKCSKITLKYWSKIIDWVVTFDKSDLFSEFLNKVSSFVLFFSRDSETKQRIKNFERICFVIYSGELDKYENKLNLLLEKISEVIKNSEASQPPLLILILFCMRILILRLSSKTLNTLFKNIWPVLLSLLIQILSKKQNSAISNNTKNPNLILSALKLIELISIVQFDDFYLHQWMFVFDYFGLKIEQINEKNPDPLMVMPKFLTPFEFEPYIVNCLPEGFKINYINKQYSDEVQQEYNKRHRQIIMTNTYVEKENELHQKALLLCQYLIANNEFRSVVDPSEIENWIEADFISLDDYIHKI